MKKLMTALSLTVLAAGVFAADASTAPTAPVKATLPAVVAPAQGGAASAADNAQGAHHKSMHKVKQDVGHKAHDTKAKVSDTAASAAPK